MISPLLDDVLEQLRGAWRFRWAAFALACAVAAAGWMVVFAMPDVYEASARVFVDTRTALKPALQGLAVEQDVNAELNYVRQSLLAGPQLETIARDSGVIPASVTDPRVAERMLDAVSDRTLITVRSANESEDAKNSGSIYGISYRDADRQRSLRVVERMLNTLIDQTIGGGRTASENAQKFLEVQIKDYETRLRAAEDRLADFKKRNVGLMPTEQGGYFTELQQETDAIGKTKTLLATAQARRAELNRQLHGDVAISVGAAAGAGPGGVPATDTVAQIAQAQAHLDELLLKFTDKHPDVIAARQTLAELKARRAAEIESLRRGDPNAVAASGASSNPVYQGTALALTQADVEIAALRAELEQHQDKAAQLHRLLNVAPQVEAEYAQLNRDYDVNKAQYTALLQNYEKARMGEKADTAGSVRFQIVEPPTADFIPVWPPRMQLLVAVFLGALGCGAALAYALHLLWPVISSARALERLTQFPVLGVVSSAFPARVAARFDLMLLGAATGCLVLAFALVVALNRAGVRLNLQALRHVVNI
jgi:polysaccharide chain length determinant protein (PEP-CTERM system associated)